MEGGFVDHVKAHGAGPAGGPAASPAERRVHIAADDGRFIAPAPFSSEELEGVAGKLVLSPDRFVWTVRGKRIFAGEGTAEGLRVWDRYWDGATPGKDVYLWPSFTLSANQDFDVDALPLRPDGDRVVQAQPNAHPWTVTDASAALIRPVTVPGAARETTTIPGRPVPGQLPKTYTFTDNRDPRNRGRFKYPVWLSDEAHVAAMQPEGPVMLVHPDDWAWLSRPETTHAGAFGADFEQQKRRVNVKGHGGYSVVVWKFPADLDRVEGFLPIPFPLPVGTYGLNRDEWCTLPAGCKAPRSSATKIRTLVGKADSGFVYVHRLVRDTQLPLAMVTTMFFIKDFYDTTEEEMARVNGFVAELHARFGLCAYACHGQQHAIVFHTHNEKPCTPQALAALLKGEPKVVEVLCAHASPGPGKDGVSSADKIRAWAAGYARHYGKDA